MTNKKSILLTLLIFIILLSGCTRFYPEIKTVADTKPAECNDSKVSEVESCNNGDLIISYKTPGAGFVVEKPNGERFSCPVVAPQYVSAVCKEALKLSCSSVCENSFQNR